MDGEDLTRRAIGQQTTARGFAERILVSWLVMSASPVPNDSTATVLIFVPLVRASHCSRPLAPKALESLMNPTVVSFCLRQ